MTEGEVWRIVPGTSGRYSASTTGRIRRIAMIECKNGRVIERPERVLKTSRNKGGYPTAKLTLCDEVCTAYVHDMVTAAFLGPKPAGLEVRHLDDVKANCSVENLRYGTRAENISDRRRNGVRIGRQVLAE